MSRLLQRDLCQAEVDGTRARARLVDQLDHVILAGGDRRTVHRRNLARARQSAAGGCANRHRARNTAGEYGYGSSHPNGKGSGARGSGGRVLNDGVP